MERNQGAGKPNQVRPSNHNELLINFRLIYVQCKGKTWISRLESLLIMYEPFKPEGSKQTLCTVGLSTPKSRLPFPPPPTLE